MDSRGVHAVVRRAGGALAYAVYAVGTTRALTDSVFPTDNIALLGNSNGSAIHLATAAEVCYNTTPLNFCVFYDYACNYNAREDSVRE